jgi:hypothetical protein
VSDRRLWGRIGGVSFRRVVLCAVLVYVTLDLSLPAMPGAFVFEPADSVESIQSTRGRGSVEVVVLPAAFLSAALILTPRAETQGRPAPTRETTPGIRVAPRHWPRATLSPASPSEEPH